MLYKKQNRSSFYILFLFFLIFFIKFSTTNVFAKIYKITDIEISEPYDLNFSKEKVIEIAFKKAFEELMLTLTTSENSHLSKTKKLKLIKTLVESFSIVDEKFINNKYIAKFEVNFSKKEVLNFFEKKNIFSSIPKKKKLFILPILVDLTQNEILLFSENPFYSNWNKFYEKYYLLEYVLPNEDLDDLNIFRNNLDNIENYDFNEIISKYQLNDYIILILFKNKNDLRILSRINLNNNLVVLNKSFSEKNLNNEDNLNYIIKDLKLGFENNWKKINLINTSIKLPITISVNSKRYDLIQKFEKKIISLDLVSNFYIESFSNQETIFKITYNGTPDKFIEEFNLEKIKIDLSNNVWKIND